MSTRTAAQALVEALLAHGVTHVFCVPGESYLPVLDALHDAPAIRVITCRHEAAAANMAEAHGKLTGRPGICMVTRGPGATHASIGVHTANQDSTPMILFVGQVARGDKGRGAFQELDYAQVFGGLAKWAAEIDDADRVGEFVGRAFATATRGRRGPVVLALPEDMLRDETAAAIAPPAPAFGGGLDPAALAAIGERLAAAETPLLVLGGSGWTSAALNALAGWAESLSLPVALSFRRKDLIDNRHPCYAGDLGLGVNPKLAARVRAADLVIALGARLGENATQGYTLLTREQTAAKLIHILSGPEEVGRVWPAAIGAVADVSPAAEALATLRPGRTWADWAASARADYDAFGAPVAVTGSVNLGDVYRHLREALPDDAIVTNGAGNYAAWLHRYFEHRAWPTQLAPTSGAMGYGLPAAIAAKILHPEREVVCAAGDGCFLMVGQELATAVQHGANIVVLVIDNGSFGTIRMHQERDFPGRTVATDLRNPDFVAYARSFGCWATRVERTTDFPAALAEARSAGRPALIHILTSVEDIAPGKSLHPENKPRHPGKRRAP